METADKFLDPLNRTFGYRGTLLTFAPFTRGYNAAIASAARATITLSAAQIIAHRAEREDSAAALAEPSDASVNFSSSVCSRSNWQIRLSWSGWWTKSSTYCWRVVKFPPRAER